MDNSRLFAILTISEALRKMDAGNRLDALPRLKHLISLARGEALSCFKREIADEMPHKPS